ncbi:hypothetical protein IKS57_01850 [bacterium]|nr:hypothetical protein [bacterium]
MITTILSSSFNDDLKLVAIFLAFALFKTISFFDSLICFNNSLISNSSFCFKLFCSY